ncbi:16S rRNA (uracil(1498)-N(3))-methyltransferase [Legionella worsleiensis]|uniref:Ribosomal RNA small subunit methyltransferase E n=1 Tax=Legionella worsleiensis TaxID=45076 RepID=A0A0W1AEF0_9GAMM|nr:16S rRNA (uracil(1498)-N(3))-methyltransferase [Legionella worsleiensis]KTD79735.1 16S ribosomal RNA methyltransferase RsmE [Legionella worsleiensis]STY32246.1 Ribosomal RNA small subunit methyltransferase E (16S rRNA m3U1498 methyltransferase) [Legionella worsleiensis]
MREIRIYQPGCCPVGQVLELTPDAGQHVAVVLRMQAGEPLTLFCGDNREYSAVIERVKKKQVHVAIKEVKEVNRESPLSVHLGQAISKGDRMELVMQKAVELGVASITPLLTERCAVKLDKERMAKKVNQWQNIVISACEQSGRNVIPPVHPPLLLEDYLGLANAASKYILHPEGKKTWRDYPIGSSDISLIIGPEGGWSDDEIKLACQSEYLPLSLGPRILRTETAAITALSVLQAVGGDL